MDLMRFEGNCWGLLGYMMVYSGVPPVFHSVTARVMKIWMEHMGEHGPSSWMIQSEILRLFIAMRNCQRVCANKNFMGNRNQIIFNV